MCDCGHPRHICQHPDNDGWFDAETTQCHAKAAMDRFSAENKEPEPGTLVYTRYTRPDSKPLPPLNSGQDALAEPDRAEHQPGDDQEAAEREATT